MQAVDPAGVDPTTNPPIPGLTAAEPDELVAHRVKIIAPPMWALLIAGDFEGSGANIAHRDRSSRRPVE